MTHRVVAVNYTTLLINSTQPDDGGTYRCEIITDVLPPETIFIDISVYNVSDEIPTTESLTTSYTSGDVTTANTTGILKGVCKNTRINKRL